MSSRPSSRRAVLVALGIVLALALVAAFAARRVGLLRTPWHRQAPEPAAHAAGPAGTLADAIRLGGAWVNGTPAAFSTAPTLVVVWCDTHPDGIAALERAAEIADAYAQYGVRVIGFHEPDFAFSADTAATARAARRAGARFPIALDPAGRMAAMLGITELRASSLVADGRGGLWVPSRGWRGVETNELILRSVLQGLHPEIHFPLPEDGSSAVEQFPGRIQEIYLGVGRASEGPLTTAQAGRAVPFTAQFQFEIEGKPRVPYPVGWWKPESDGLIAARGGAATFVALRYEGGVLDAVLSPPPGATTRVWILSDEHWLPVGQLGADAKLDARGASYVDVTEPRLYQVARGAGAHLIKLSPDAAGVTFHALLIEPASDQTPAR